MSSQSAEWLSTAEAAKHLGITASTLYRLIDHDRLPAYRLGRLIRLRPGDLETFIADARITLGTLGHLYPKPTGPPLTEQE